jgi:hypothetical protein
MKCSIGMTAAFALVLAAPALAGQTDVGTTHHHHAYRHARQIAPAEAIAPSATTRAPLLAPTPVRFRATGPYPSGQGDEDGLSRHIGDCNKGCIGGNPG